MILLSYGNASGAMKLRRRISARSIPRSRAARSMSRSTTEHAMLASGAAIRRDDRLVGEHRRKSRVVVGDVIRTKQRALAVDRHRQPIGIVGPAVMQKHVLDAEDAPIAAERHFGVVDLAALMGGGKEVLPAVLDPFDRALKAHRGPGQHHLLRVEQHDLGSEAAPKIMLFYPEEVVLPW